MPTSPRFQIPCRPAYQHEATSHRRVVRHSFQCRPPDKAMPRAQKQVRHFQCGQEFCDFAVAYNTVHKEWVHGKHHLSDDQAYQVCYSMLRIPSGVLILNFNFFLLLFGCSPFVHVHDWTAHGKPMLISRNQVRAHGIIEGSTGSAIRTSGTMMIKPLLFYGFRSNYLSVFNITFYLFDVGDDYLKSCVAEVIKSSWSWVSLR